MKRKVFNRIIVQTVITLGAVIFIFPFLWLVSTSLKPEAQIFVLPPQLIPKPIQWENYTRMFKYFSFFRFFSNSVYITLMVLIGTLFSSPLVAFSFARLRWPARDFLFIVLLSTMMLPPQVTMVPVYLIFRELRWIDSFRPLWVPSWFGSAFYIFLLRQFFLTIPRELEDAAKIDGCSFPRIYTQIMLPLIKPALATTAIFTFMGAWNDFMGPLIYINSTEKMPLSLGLRLFQTQFGGEWAMMMAASTMMVIPLVVMFIVFQRYFIQGIVLTGLKM
jgi:ABC-type glycerol-3-phosphate transport system permease component